jgi:hypothetical protein
MKRPLLALLLAALCTSCALFAYGTGRLNPIFVGYTAAFTVGANSTHYLSLTVPGAQLRAAMPAPTGVYAPENLVRAPERRTVGLRDARWNVASAPSGWGLTLGNATAELAVTQGLEAVGSDTVSVVSDVAVTEVEYSLLLDVPQNAPPGSYALSGRFSPEFGGAGTTLNFTATVVAGASGGAAQSGKVQVSDGSTVVVRAGGTYTLSANASGFVPFNPARLYADALDSFTRYDRVRGDEWRVRAVNLPPRWELEWLEGNLSIAIFARSSSIGFSQVRTEYTLAYNDLRLLMGLRAIGVTAPGSYTLQGQLEYRGTPVQPIAWTVNVQP